VEGLDDCAWLNLFEYSTWTGIPLLGGWIKRAQGRESPSFLFFLPNALFKVGMATNVVLWLMRRAHWVREMRWANLQDKSMMEIFENRFGKNPPSAPNA
jgi:hypothetical protein